jgi:hypothetical protein
MSFNRNVGQNDRICSWANRIVGIVQHRRHLIRLARLQFNNVRAAAGLTSRVEHFEWNEGFRRNPRVEVRRVDGFLQRTLVVVGYALCCRCYMNGCRPGRSGKTPQHRDHHCELLILELRFPAPRL